MILTRAPGDFMDNYIFGSRAYSAQVLDVIKCCCTGFRIILSMIKVMSRGSQ
jgi:hypothetical protein